MAVKFAHGGNFFPSLPFHFLLEMNDSGCASGAPAGRCASNPKSKGRWFPALGRRVFKNSAFAADKSL